MYLFYDAMLGEGVDMEPSDIVFKPDGVWQEVGILDDFLSGLRCGEARDGEVSGFAEDVC